MCDSMVLHVKHIPLVRDGTLCMPQGLQAWIRGRDLFMRMTLERYGKMHVILKEKGKLP